MFNTSAGIVVHSEAFDANPRQKLESLSQNLPKTANIPCLYILNPYTDRRRLRRFTPPSPSGPPSEAVVGP